MRIEAIQLRQKERLKLWEVTPLPRPLMLYIEPTSLCNMRCAFCPTGDSKLKQLRPNGMMSYDLFCKVVEDVKEIGRLKRVNLYKDGESLVNPRFVDMVEYLRASGATEEIWLKTNGLLLEPSLNQRLIDAGLDFIGISVKQVTNDGILRVTRTKADYDKFLAGVADLYRRREGCHIYASIADSGLTPAEIETFYRDFEPITDTCAVEHLHGWSMSEARDWTMGTNPTTFEGQELTDKIACPIPFFALAVNWNGTVSICNEDWAHKTIVGDLRSQSLREVWEGHALREMRKMHLEGRRGENDACRNCYYLKTLLDNIDEHREEMLENI